MIVSREQAVTPNAAQPNNQSALAGQLDGLRRNQMVLELRVNDLGTQLSQLVERRELAMTRDERQRFSQPIADAEHRLKAATLDADFNRHQIGGLEKIYARATISVPPPRDPLFGRKQLEETEIGVFLLLLPVVFALTRRIWVRRGTHVDQVAVLRERGLEPLPAPTRARRTPTARCRHSCIQLDSSVSSHASVNGRCRPP